MQDNWVIGYPALARRVCATHLTPFEPPGAARISAFHQDKGISLSSQGLGELACLHIVRKQMY